MAQTDTARKPEVTMGRRLAAARVILGLSQSAAAEITGVSQDYISRLENDIAPSPPLLTVARLARLYGVTLDYIVGDEWVAGAVPV